MKKPILIFVFALTAFLAPARADEITLNAPTAATSSFDVSVDVTDVFSSRPGDLLIAYGFDISFDSAILSYTGETPGSLFTDLSSNPGIGAQVAGFATDVFLGPGDFTEPLTLAVLHFQPIGTGLANISITGDPSNPDQGLFFLAGSDPISASATVGVNLVAAPEPSSFFLCVLGIVGIGVLRKRIA